MKNIIIIMLLVAASVASVYAGDVKQLSDDTNLHYTIAVTHGGEAIGEIELELFPELAPEHCRNFDSLVEIRFYDRTAFHRVIPDFMVQGGDPNSRDGDKSTWGFGDPSQRSVPAEFSSELHLRGTLSAARGNDINSATSQFFLCVVPCPWLDNKYSIYGEVTSGMDVVDQIVNVPRDGNDNPNEKVEMTITKKTTSAEDLINPSAGAITIYPNPAKDMISFRSEDNALVSSVQIINLNGKAVFEEEFANGAMLNDVSLNLTNLNTGLYLMRIFKADGTVSRLKIMISK
jgi:peptidyl-prolyl cis-trans isomerase B (cyclophilin B)